ncbi:prephenate dehydrogenase (NADP(+)) [Exophiala dermatitidis]|uniref:Prephenate dehydrogenase (NADP(+)) n=1 Tax=Exophiala dermatitidis TaxID=5970 RepID=A0AAN6IZA0_EXODE|nr:prephenate dehydrogenase (NADP(+)) [Exophiala dermatitidis]KAJ4527575.1 prephenate dehydrogenase (NADP(+)) [Exophiala dermatitidis]KAJ4531149.1 prephenate dehydrogenase (NADP(+)) [Exophiala dermatitidis]KAJ4607112.1 prephenate dehydrogenase (NADP(+)) [Exophiala dermatitidis]KAJ4608104.1 prephenate dehydrogenase (NADP(+)) [Exophiala dermatitidis]
METLAVGIIGMGDMGRMYAKRFSQAGWRVNACDRPDKFQSLQTEYENEVCVVDQA